LIVAASRSEAWSIRNCIYGQRERRGCNEQGAERGREHAPMRAQIRQERS
jgi:hypothetical protein